MKLVDAIIKSSEGQVVVSEKGNEYTPQELAATTLGDEAVTFISGVISKEEEKLSWKAKRRSMSVLCIGEKKAHGITVE